MGLRASVDSLLTDAPGEAREALTRASAQSEMKNSNRKGEGRKKKGALLAAEENREVLSVLRAAELLGKSRDTIYRWLDAGLLEGRKVGGQWVVYRDSVERIWQEG